ncbi:exonuclease SbcCD subunit D [Thermodesulfobacteriota bacterium]
MRFIHTADWHLGRLFYGRHLTEDQEYVLDQLIQLAADEKPDVLLIAGDVYDRAVPPPEAVGLLDDVLSRLVLDLHVPVIMIAGNHDSPDRLGFGSRVLAGQGLHVIGSPRAAGACVTLTDDAGPVHFFAVPFIEPSIIRYMADQQDSQDTPQDYSQAFGGLLRQARAARPSVERSVLVSHAFVSGGAESESERPLSVGGADRLPVDCFDDFSYTALGHLHGPQKVGRENVRYAGSILKYSFSEVNQSKGVSLVEMDETGSCIIQEVKLTPQRDVRRVEGHIREFLEEPEKWGPQDDYVLVSLLDKDAFLDVRGKLETVFNNVMQIERPQLAQAGENRSRIADHRKLSDVDLFDSFFREVTGDPLTKEEKAAYERIVDELRRCEREVSK